MTQEPVKYEMDTVQTVDIEKIRKLPIFWRKMNVAYQFLMILLSFANVLMTVIDANDNTTIPKLYFQIYSCVISLSFVAWNKMLDAVKEYQDTLEPTPAATNASTAIPITTTTPTNDSEIPSPKSPKKYSSTSNESPV